MRARSHTRHIDLFFSYFVSRSSILSIYELYVHTAHVTPETTHHGSRGTQGGAGGRAQGLHTLKCAQNRARCAMVLPRVDSLRFGRVFCSVGILHTAHPRPAFYHLFQIYLVHKRTPAGRRWSNSKTNTTSNNTVRTHCMLHERIYVWARVLSRAGEAGATRAVCQSSIVSPACASLLLALLSRSRSASLLRRSSEHSFAATCASKARTHQRWTFSGVALMAASCTPP